MSELEKERRTRVAQDEPAIDMMELLRKIGPLPRTLACKATDEALDIVASYLKRALPNTKIESYPTGSKAWTWTIPQRWELNSASIRVGKKIFLDGAGHPLHVINYSKPFRGMVSKDELLKRLHTNPARPSAIPFIFSFYQDTWGFAVSHEWLERFKADTRDIESFEVEIDCSFEEGDLKVLASHIPGQLEETFVICSNICHPGQVNDSLTGVAAGADLAVKLAARTDLKYSYLFLVLPETIGSIAYFANHPEMIKKSVGGIFGEMLGTPGPLVGQLSRKGTTYWDFALKESLKASGVAFKTVPFLKSAANDEKVMDSPGVDIPTVSVTRYPYPEYHTSDDCVALISDSSLRESRDVLMSFLDMVEGDYVPELVHPGPVFLSGYDLYPDWRSSPSLKPMWDAFLEVMYAIDGKRSMLELARDTGLSFAQVKYWCDGFARKDLLRKKPFVITRERQR